MMNLNLFLAAAVWIAIIATVSVSAAKESDAATDFNREEIVNMELEEQDRELANYGVPYSNGYAAYGSSSYGSGNSYPDRYTNNNNNNHGYNTPPANTGYTSYPATVDRHPTYKRTSTTSYSGGGYSSGGGYYGGKGGKGGGYYGGKGGKGGYGRGGNTGNSFYYSGSSSTPVYTTNSYGNNHGSSTGSTSGYGNTYGHGSTGYGKTYGRGSSSSSSSSSGGSNNGYGKTYGRGGSVGGFYYSF